jgi:hypothetical protein
MQPSATEGPEMLRDDPLFLIASIGGLIVVAILMVGIGGFARGGEFNRRHGNRMMRWRIIAQAVVVALVVGYMFLRNQLGE